MTDRTIIWRCLFQPGMEHFMLGKRADGWLLAGSAVAVADGVSLLVTYAVQCSSDWRTRQVDLSVTRSGQQQTLSLQPQGDGRWFLNGQPVDGVDGCIDIDLGITPATNTLPIRRLNLAIGQSADVVATWVRFPSLAVEPLSQRYTRLSRDRYRYESDTGFTTELEVDDDGIVTTYEGGWERAG